jgi:hypothetical protein
VGSVATLISTKRDQGERTGAPPAGITKRVGISQLTQIAGNTLRRPDGYTSADHAHRRFRLRLRHPRAQWSRPMAAHGCSMVARMPRYAPAPSGIHSESRIPATGQNDSSRHVLASFDSSSKSRIEFGSGLLISGLGVQVPRGAPYLTWDYTDFRLFFLCPICPVAGSVLARVFFGRSCGAVKLGQIGLDQLIRLV